MAGLHCRGVSRAKPFPNLSSEPLCVNSMACVLAPQDREVLFCSQEYHSESLPLNRLQAATGICSIKGHSVGHPGQSPSSP